jgi:hypothetical protein
MESSIVNYVRAILGLEVSEEDITIKDGVALVRPKQTVNSIEIEVTVE